MNPTANTSSKKRRMRLPLYAAGGAVVGFISSAAITKLPSDLNWTLSVYYDYDLLFALIALAVLVMTIWNSISLARTPSARPEEDEADDIGDHPSLMSPAERSLGSAMMLSTFSVITSFAWVALALSLYASSRDLPKSSNLFTLGNLVAACIAVIIVVVLQSVTIKRYNRYFPDRALDLNSRNMQKNHFEKLDEGEKWIVYRAAYRSFQMMNLLLGVGMAALVVYSILFSFAAFPIILLSVIWIINIGVYFRETYRAQKQ